MRPLSFALTFAALALAAPLPADVVISEIMYHPVERPAFTPAGDPVLDLSDDVHEFIELHNSGPTPVSLAGWKLRGGIRFDFPPSAAIPPGGFTIIASQPDRLAALPAYALAPNSVLGPWAGQLSNSGDSVRLESISGSTIDAVSYSSSSPWPVSAHALGAESDWTGLDESLLQYRGRSLERISFSSPASDPANWIASPLPAGPSPGRPNSISLPSPILIATTVSAVQHSTNSTLIRPAEPIRIDARFSSTLTSPPSVEFFRDDINLSTETRSSLPMAPVPSDPGLWRAILPGQASRSIIRYRLLSSSPPAPTTISPRADDPFAWHACFISPIRSSPRPIYDLFISSASLSRLTTNISQSPRRIVYPDPPGLPRASWTATEPAVLIRDGLVIDVRMRHHGSRYRRDPSRASYKIQFPRYSRLDSREAIFLKDKGEEHRVASLLYRAAGLPAFSARYADLYLNSNALLQRLEVPEMDERHFEAFAASEALRFPGSSPEPTGEFYKSTGTVPFETAAGIGTTNIYSASGEGPYFIGNASPIPPKQGWLTRQRYEYTYGPQMHTWIGGRDTESLITGLWNARGDSPLAPAPDLPALRAFLASRFDVNATLDYIAIRNWCSPVDDVTHNHFLWRRANGRWAMLPWDVDGELSNTTQHIYWDEFAIPQPDTLRGPHWIKDSFLKAFRNEFRQRLWLLNHTILLPAAFGPSGYNGLQSFATARHSSVNTQLALGTFHRPATPIPAAPAPLASVLPGARLLTAPYSHSAPTPAPPHASTTWLIRASGTPWDRPIARITSSVSLTDLPIPFDALTFGTTYFWKCFFTDRDGHPSFESPERTFSFGSTPASSPPIQLNEIFARGSSPDFIELLNTSSSPAELSGMGLTDNPAAPAKFTFPPATVLAPGVLLTITLDSRAPFRLDGDGQTVILLNPDGSLADAISFGPQAPDFSLARSPTGWQLANPSPGNPNTTTAALGSPSALRFNEWMASNPDGPDWLELANPSALPVPLAGIRITNSPSISTLPALSFIGPRGFQQFIADRNPGPHHLDFKLSASGASLSLSLPSGDLINSLTFGPQVSGISEGRLPDASGPATAFPGSDSPGDPNALAITDVVISRLYPDIELFNASSQPVSLANWSLSPAIGSPLAFSFLPDAPPLAPGATLSLNAASLPFALDPIRGGNLFLEHDGTHRSRQPYGPFDGRPWGRVSLPDSSVFVPILPSPATPNNIPAVGPVVISEFNYHPPDAPGDNSLYEFIEIHNTSTSSVDLSGWQLDGDVSFSLPEGTSLRPGGFLVFSPLPPAEFLARFSVPDGTSVVGPWSGSLDNGNGTVRLIRRLPPVAIEGPDFGFTPEITADEVLYRDSFPWPPAADGTGPALTRSLPDSFGLLPDSWSPAPPSPGALPSPNTPPAITIVSPSGTSAPAGIPLSFSASASDPDGRITAVQWFVNGTPAATSTTPPYLFSWSSTTTGPQTISATAWDDRLAASSASFSLNLLSDPPMAAILSPAQGTRFNTAAPIPITAAARDPEGLLQQVDFFANSTLIGSASSPPWQFTWLNASPGPHLLTARATDLTGLTSTSLPVTIFVATAAADATITAFHVPAGVTGNQSYNGSLGMDFDVISPILVTRLGVFDSGANGLSATLTAQLWRTAPTQQLLASLSFSTASPGTLAPSSSNRFKDLTTPLSLPAGSYSIVAFGYSTTEPNGNTSGAVPTWSTNDGGGLLRFSGTSRYGNANQFPPTPDGGPANRYAAGTFAFLSADRDSDGLPSDWESANGLNPADPSDSLSDLDSDGTSNLSEFAAGTDPRNAASTFRITSVSTSANTITVRFPLAANRKASLQTSPDLIFWSEAQSVTATASPRDLSLSIPANQNTRFLRVAASLP